VNFDYACPGPHTVEISAVGENKRAATSSVAFDEQNHAVSVTSSIVVEESK
jgi:hypothetical protein